VVLEAGVKVTHLRPGDRVWGALPYTNQGTFSELLVLPGKFLSMFTKNKEHPNTFI
jgi:NADPH:quinone reductase-like Zn-dependent oxidoreductase